MYTTTNSYDDEMFFDDSDVEFFEDDDEIFFDDSDAEFFEDDEISSDNNDKILKTKEFLNQIVGIATIAGKNGEKLHYVSGELIDTDKNLVHVLVTFRDEAHYQRVKNYPMFCVQETRRFEFDVDMVAYAILHSATLGHGVRNDVRRGNYLESVFTWMNEADCQLYKDLVNDFCKTIYSVVINK